MGNWTAGEWTVDIDGVICADGWPIGSIVPTDRDANARLISAAPDMAEALKAALAEYGIRSGPDDALRPANMQPAAIQQVMAALAKAGVA